MKALKNAFIIGVLGLTLGACSTMTTVQERDTYAQPSWYAKCKDAGTSRLDLGGAKTMLMLVVPVRVSAHRRQKSRCMLLL